MTTQTNASTPIITASTPIIRPSTREKIELKSDAGLKSERETGSAAAPSDQVAQDKQVVQEDIYRARSRDEVRYYLAQCEAGTIRRVLAMEERRARRLKGKPFQRDPEGQGQEHYERRLAEEEQTMATIRAQYAGQSRIDLWVTLASIGVCLVAAREAGGLTQADLARHLHVAVSEIQQWEQTCYADLTLADLVTVMTVLDLDPSTSVWLCNKVPNLRE